MTNNQEKVIRGKLQKYLEAKAVSETEREAKLAGWMEYFRGIANATVCLAACTWMCSGAVILPEDMQKVEDAVTVALNHRVDPLQYKRPMEIIERYGELRVKEAAVDPDTVPTLHLVKKFESGLAIYNVDESQESRENMRRIINTHFGEAASPWCLLQGDGKGKLTEGSARYWKHYSAYPKQVAFFDGKLAAFSANSDRRRVWWDRQDAAHDCVVSSGKVKGDALGRSATMEFDQKTGELTDVRDIYRWGKGGWGKSVYDSLKSEVPYEVIQIPNPDVVRNAERYVIPEGVTEISGSAFYYCSSLKEVYIPEGVKEIGGLAFRGCSSLKEVHIPEGVTKISGGAFAGCSSLKEVHIPENVTEIGVSAFQGCSSLKEVHIPENVTEIGWSAFYGCSSLEEVHIPESVTGIGKYAFEGCSSLKEAHVPESVTEIGDSAFRGCSSLKEVHIPDGVTKIEVSAFDGCSSLKEVHIPEGVTEIGVCAFYDCESLEEVHIPESVKEIGRCAFKGCSSLKEVHIPEGVTEIGGSAFQGCWSLREVYIAEGVTKIGEYAFWGCSALKEVHIPEGVKVIGEYAFWDCSALRVIVAPAGLDIPALPKSVNVVRRDPKVLAAIASLGGDRELYDRMLSGSGGQFAEIAEPYVHPKNDVIKGDNPQRVNGGRLELFCSDRGEVFVTAPGGEHLSVREFASRARTDLNYIQNACRAQEARDRKLGEVSLKENVSVQDKPKTQRKI